MNSVKKEIDANTLASDIRLHRAVHQGTFLLVEGHFDAQLFKQFVDREQCVITVGNGKESVLGAIAILEISNFCGALGIVDRDFDWCDGQCSANNNIILTDYNDLEITILTSSAFDRVLAQYGSDDKIERMKRLKGNSVLELILGETALLGGMRMASRDANWNLKFRDVKIKFNSNTGYTIDYSSTAEYIIRVSGKSKAFTAVTL
jgi:Protein of unknown function (DUF4435)